MEPNKKHTIDDLNKLYSDGETEDQAVWAEQRSNLLLVSGEHYTKKHQGFLNRVRGNENLNSDQKIRLTKNHTQKLMKLYENNLLNMAPGMICAPQNDKEQQDIKAAELHEAVRKHYHERINFRKRTRDFAKDFFQIGEVCSLILWDPNKGDLIGYEQALDEMGQPAIDELGRPMSTDVPVYTGDFVVKRILGFNVFRAKDAQSMEESPFIGFRELMDKKELEKQFEGDEQKKKAVASASNESFMLFDHNTSNYRAPQNENLVLTKWYFFRPCAKYPKGYFFWTTSAGILAEGELPGGIFPIIFETCEDTPTSPRGRSPIKTIRPFQVEINRAASKIAEHQVALGDDKLILSNGSKVTQGVSLPGIRTVHTSGQAPVVVEGRAGDQYLPYIAATIEEMYRVMMIEEDLITKQDGNIDPYAQLYKSMRQKKQFSMYAEKFESFLKQFWEVFLQLAKFYLEDNTLIMAVGRQEAINIPEFKSSTPFGYQIKLMEVSDDIETVMGKQLTFNHLVQFIGPQLTREDLGLMIRNMPLANSEQAFEDLSIDVDNATNDILMLDRGEMPILDPQGNATYTLKKITNRMKKADFRLLDPRIQQSYMMYRDQLAKLIADQQAQIQAANADNIPAQGFLTTVDFYVPDPMKPGSNKRAKLPMDSLAWLIQRLEQQGVSLQQLERLQPGAQQAVASMALANQQGVQAQGSAGEFLANSNQGVANGNQPNAGAIGP